METNRNKDYKSCFKQSSPYLRKNKNNGGLREECSIVTSTGKIFRGETGVFPDIKNGIPDASVTLPQLARRKEKIN